MDLAALRTFLDVCAAGSFAGAARRRGVDASTVSRAVAGLEAGLGVRLFHRTTRQLHLTPEGERLRTHAERVCEGVEAMVADVSGRAGEVSGILRVGASSSFGLEVLAPLLPGFRARHPGVEVELDLSDARVDVLGARLDVAVRHGRLADSGLVASRLLDVEYRLVASPDYLKTPVAEPGDLIAHDLLTFTHPGFRDRWRLRRGGEVVEIPVAPALRATGALALRSCARAGMGIAILPDWALTEMAGLERVLPDWEAGGPEFGAAIWIMRPGGAHVPARVRAFVDHLRAELGGPSWVGALRSAPSGSSSRPGRARA